MGPNEIRQSFFRAAGWRETSITLVAASALSLMLATPSRGFDAAQVKAFCLAVFETALSASGKTAAAGMAEFTCKCFLDKVQNGDTIDKARAACRAQATARYKVK